MRIKLSLKNEGSLILLISLGGLALRLLQISSGFWHDEVASLIISTGTPLEVVNHLKGDFHPPLFYWLLNFWMRYAGRSEIVIRMPFVLLSALAIPLTYFLGKKITGSGQAAFWAAIFMAVNPLHIYYSDELRMYGMATTLCVASWLALYSENSRKNLLIYVATTVLGLFTFYGLWFSFFAQVIVMLKRREYRHVIIALLFSLGLLMWWWPVLETQLGGSTFMKANLPGWTALSGDLTPKSLLMIPLKWVIGRLNINGDKSLLLSSLGALGYTIFVAAWAIKNKKSKDVLLALCVPLLLAIVISIKAPMLGYWRYVYLIPFFCILLSIGLLSMDKRGQLINFGALFTIFLFCNITYFMTPQYWREDWIGVGDFFKPLEGKRVVAIYTFFDDFPAAKWYLNYLPGEAVLGDIRASGEQFDRRMTQIADGKESIIVFDYLNDLTDTDRSVRKWLIMAGYNEKNIHSFRGVGQVFEYVPSQE